MLLLTLSLQKLEGSKVKAAGGEAVVFYCEPLPTKDLESSDFYNDGVKTPPAWSGLRPGAGPTPLPCPG